jgi:hypothetical protein
MGACRTCGAECAEADLWTIHEGGGCVHCNGSPACTRCGHARKHHRGAFSSNAPRCEARVAIDGSLDMGRCGCAGFTRDPSAFGETPAIVDIDRPRLRVAGSADPPPGARTRARA